jgi:hypothetical protein
MNKYNKQEDENNRTVRYAADSAGTADKPAVANAVLWDVTPCRWVHIYKHSSGTIMHFFQTPRRHIPVPRALHGQSHDDVTCHVTDYTCFCSRMESNNVCLTFKRRIKSHLPFAGIIRSSPYSPRFQDKG